MHTYTTDISQLFLNQPVYLAYAPENNPVIVSGAVEAFVHLGMLGGQRPQIAENVVLPSPAWGVLEAYRLWFPDHTGSVNNLVFNGPVQFHKAIVGQNDGNVLDLARSELGEFVASLKDSNIPIIFSTYEAAAEFLNNPENLELARKHAEHYQQALTVETRTRNVGYDNNGQPIIPTEEQLEQAIEEAKKSNLKPPEAPAKIYTTQTEKQEDSNNEGRTDVPGMP